MTIPIPDLFLEVQDIFLTVFDPASGDGVEYKFVEAGRCSAEVGDT